MRKLITGVVGVVCLALILCPVTGLAQDRDQAFSQGKQALEAKDCQEAYEIFSSLVREYPADDEVNFNLGLAAYCLGKYPHALFAFERVLIRNPAADRVRLEIAKTYLAMGQSERAKTEFQTVLNHNPPAQVRANIEKIIGEIDAKRKNWKMSGQLSMGAFYDDNINSGLADEDVRVAGGLLSITSQDSMRKDDFGHFGSLALNFDYRLDDSWKWSWYTGGQAYQKSHYHHPDYDLTYVKLRSGVQYTGERDLFAFGLKFEDVNYGWDSLIDVYGIEPLYVHILTPRVQLITTAGIEARAHHQENGRDAQFFSAAQSVRILFGEGGHEFMPGIRLFRQNAEEPKYSYDGYELTAGLKFKLPRRFELSVGGAYRVTDYRSKPTDSALLSNKERVDVQRRLNLGLVKNMDQWLDGLSVGLNAQFIDNESNFDPNCYNKSSAAFSVNYKF